MRTAVWSLGDSGFRLGLAAKADTADCQPSHLAIEGFLKAFEHLALLGWIHLPDVLKLPPKCREPVEMVESKPCPFRFPSLHRKQECSFVLIKL